MKLLIDEIEDTGAQENFRRLQKFLDEFPLARGQFKFFSLNFTAASYPATVSIPHNLGFVPKDVLQTSVIGSGTLTWQYTQFTKTDLVATVTAAMAARAFVGTYAEGRTL